MRAIKIFHAMDFAALTSKIASAVGSDDDRVPIDRTKDENQIHVMEDEETDDLLQRRHQAFTHTLSTVTEQSPSSPMPSFAGSTHVSNVNDCFFFSFDV